MCARAGHIKAGTQTSDSMRRGKFLDPLGTNHIPKQDSSGVSYFRREVLPILH